MHRRILAYPPRKMLARHIELLVNISSNAIARAAENPSCSENGRCDRRESVCPSKRIDWDFITASATLSRPCKLARDLISPDGNNAAC